MPYLIAFLLVVLAVHVAKCDLPNSTKEAIHARLDYFEGILNQTYKSLEANLKNANPPCSLTPACGPGAPSYVNYHMNFTEGIDPQYAKVQIRLPSSTANLSRQQQTVCAANALLPQWSKNYEDSARTIYWQYYANFENLFAVFPISAWQCESPYLPTKRPFYASSASQQRDLIILIDVSVANPDSSDRLLVAKEVAKGLLRALSFRDYVGIGIYDTDVTFLTGNVLVGGSVNNIENFCTMVDSIELRNTAVNLGKAVSAAQTLFSSSTEAGETSECTHTIALLSSGRSDYTDPNPASVLDEAGIIVFSYLIRIDDTIKLTRNAISRMACRSKGFLRVLNSSAGAPSTVQAMNDYFSTLYDPSTPVRWSEHYTDALGQGSIISGGLPIYHVSSSGIKSVEGVLVMDIPLNNFSKLENVSATDLDEYLLENQQCSAIDPRDESKAPTVAAMQGDACSDVDESVPLEEAGIKKAKVWLVLGTLLLAVALGGGPFLITRQRSLFLLSILTPFFAFFAVLAIIFFFVFVFADWVSIGTFISVEYKITAQRENPYRCCEVRNCQCTQYYGFTSCSSLVTKLSEGTCGNGYYCCQRESYSCNCHKDSKGRWKCNTCYRCAYAVGNRLCQVVCGTCHRPQITVTYVFRGTMMVSQMSIVCGLNNTECVNSYFAARSVGDIHEGFVNPENPYDIREVLTVRTVFVVFTIIFGLIAIVIVSVTWCQALTCRRKVAWDEAWSTHGGRLADY